MSLARDIRGAIVTLQLIAPWCVHCRVRMQAIAPRVRFAFICPACEVQVLPSSDREDQAEVVPFRRPKFPLENPRHLLP